MANLMDALSEEKSELKSTESKKSTGGGGATLNGELMRRARESLEGNWAMAVVGAFLFYLLVSSVGSFVSSVIMFSAGDSLTTVENIVPQALAVPLGGTLILGLLQAVIFVGFCSFFLVIVQDNETRLECLFTGFKRFWATCGATILSSLFVHLWSLLFIIPGIIAVFRYAMIYFIIADDPNVGPLEAIRRSKEMMKGNKWKFFCLHWRFFGWLLLCPLTCGIGYLWLVPYMQTTVARFYEDVK